MITQKKEKIKNKERTKDKEENDENQNKGTKPWNADGCRERERERERATLYLTWNLSTQRHTQVYLIDNKKYDIRTHEAYMFFDM